MRTSFLVDVSYLDTSSVDFCSQRGRRRRGFLRKQNICYKKKLWFTRLEKEQRETFEFGLLTRQVQCSSVVLDPLSVNLTGHHFLGVESVREGLETIFQFASPVPVSVQLRVIL